MRGSRGEQRYQKRTGVHPSPGADPAALRRGRRVPLHRRGRRAPAPEPPPPRSPPAGDDGDRRRAPGGDVGTAHGRARGVHTPRGRPPRVGPHRHGDVLVRQVQVARRRLPRPSARRARLGPARPRRPVDRRPMVDLDGSRPTRLRPGPGPRGLSRSHARYGRAAPAPVALGPGARPVDDPPSAPFADPDRPLGTHRGGGPQRPPRAAQPAPRCPTVADLEGGTHRHRPLGRQSARCAPAGDPHTRRARPYHPTVQLIWGEDDTFGPPAVGEQAADLIPDAELYVVPGGHGPWFRYAEHIADRLTPFLLKHALTPHPGPT